MSTTIFYFSGRGNALNAARMIAGKLGNTQLVPVVKALEKKRGISSDCIGFVFPVICFGMPNIVSRLIKVLDLTDTKYIFAAITTGGMPAGTLPQLKNRLRKRGIKLSAGFYLLSNGTKESLDQWHRQTDEIVSIIRDKKEQGVGKVKFLDRYILTGMGNRLAAGLSPNTDKKFFTDDNCDGCGICQKVCPVKNILIKEDRPIWLHQCEQCGACFNWCPKKALHGKNLAAKTYHLNPNVELNDFLN